MYEIDADKLYDSIVEISKANKNSELADDGSRIRKIYKTDELYDGIKSTYYEMRAEKYMEPGDFPEYMGLGFKSGDVELELYFFDDPHDPPEISYLSLRGYLTDKLERDSVLDLLNKYDGDWSVSLEVGPYGSEIFSKGYKITPKPSAFFDKWDKIDVRMPKVFDSDVYDSLKESLDTIGISYSKKANLIKINRFQGFKRFSTEKFVDAYMKADERGLFTKIETPSIALLGRKYLRLDAWNLDKYKLDGIIADMRDIGLNFTDEWELSYRLYCYGTESPRWMVRIRERV